MEYFQGIFWGVLLRLIFKTKEKGKDSQMKEKWTMIFITLKQKFGIEGSLNERLEENFI